MIATGREPRQYLELKQQHELAHAVGCVFKPAGAVRVAALTKHEWKQYRWQSKPFAPLQLNRVGCAGLSGRRNVVDNLLAGLESKGWIAQRLVLAPPAPRILSLAPCGHQPDKASMA